MPDVGDRVADVGFVLVGELGGHDGEILGVSGIFRGDSWVKL